MDEPTTIPIQPGFYCYEPDLGWIKFDQYIDMALYRLEDKCLCRIVKDPFEEE